MNIELIENVLLTSLIIMLVCNWYVKYRGNGENIKYIEKAVVIILFLISGVFSILSALTLIWI